MIVAVITVDDEVYMRESAPVLALAKLVSDGFSGRITACAEIRQDETGFVMFWPEERGGRLAFPFSKIKAVFSSDTLEVTIRERLGGRRNAFFVGKEALHAVQQAAQQMHARAAARHAEMEKLATTGTGDPFEVDGGS